MTEKKFRKVQPCGMLYSQGQEFFLLHPKPIEKDSWQSDGVDRWVVVPRKPDENGNYPFARHSVSNAYLVVFSPDMPEINIWQLGDIDVANAEWLPEQYDDPVPADVATLLNKAWEIK